MGLRSDIRLGILSDTFYENDGILGGCLIMYSYKNLQAVGSCGVFYHVTKYYLTRGLGRALRDLALSQVS